MSSDQNDKKEEVHYAAEEYAVDDYVAPAVYSVPQGYYNDEGEFVEVSTGSTDPNQPPPPSSNYHNRQYYSDPNQYYYGYNYSSAYGDNSTAPPGTENVSTAATGAPPGTYNYDQYYSQGYYDSSYYNDSATAMNDITPSTSTSAAAYGNNSSMIPPSDSTASKMPSATPAPKPYFPPPANSNQPIGPIVMTRSGYTGQDNTTSTTDSTSSGAVIEAASENNSNSKKKKKKTAIRAAGGEVWEDATLLDWDENDYRLFAGDLGNEVTEELLFKTFSKYPSLTRTRVVRDKRTMKSKGYGFISFKDPDDFVRAWREMNGKYVGNRPIKLRKSNWKERNLDVKVKKERERFGPYAKHK
ncbi:hypothetical protein BDF20DRAFT_898282 [Mycotypha africana]|uniref:uncharacterized protein n=1 Tax=Mycotypha africana TaxID=64632 RepID=UPI002301B356|nr:uncharacterized protein BDF20DRAFT_898282 [Mycotypha africana]KAI8967994.1 hypothetical protein BDF20DRAFT_898282 [Mycotypha africana]